MHPVGSARRSHPLPGEVWAVLTRILPAVLILAIIGAGMLIGGLAQMLLGTKGRHVNWTLALIAGVAGSLVGGLLFSLISGNGLDLTVRGLIGTFIGALIITALYQWYERSQREKEREAELHAKRSGRHH